MTPRVTLAAYPVGGGGGWWAQLVAIWARAGVPLAVAAVVAVHIGLGLAYANATPIWQNPDEPAHYNYLAYVARTGGLPELRPGDWDSAVLERLKNGQIQPTDPQVSTIRYESWQPPLFYVLAGLAFRLGPEMDPVAEVRLLRGFDVLVGGLTLLVAFLLGRRLFPESRWLGLAVPLVISGVPMFSSVTSAISADPLANLLAAALALLLLRGLRRQVPAAPTPRARPPQSSPSKLEPSTAEDPRAWRDPTARGPRAGGDWSAAGATAGAEDPPAWGGAGQGHGDGEDACAASSASARTTGATNPEARGAQDPQAWREQGRTLPSGWAVTTGLLLGLGLLTKLALAVFVPLALGVAAWQGQRWRGRIRVYEVASLVIVPVVLSAPWLVHQVTTYGWLDPLATQRHAQVVLDQPRFPGLSPEYLSAFATTTFHSFWAQFGWMAIPAPDRLYWVWGGLSALGLLGLVRSRLDARWGLMGAVVLMTLIAYVGYNLAYLQLQGRYLFIGLAPIAALLVRGWAAWLPGRLAPAAPLAIGAVLVLLNAYTLLRVLVPGFRG